MLNLTFKNRSHALRTLKRIWSSSLISRASSNASSSTSFGVSLITISNCFTYNLMLCVFSVWCELCVCSSTLVTRSNIFNDTVLNDSSHWCELYLFFHTCNNQQIFSNNFDWCDFSHFPVDFEKTMFCSLMFRQVGVRRSLLVTKSTPFS